jgi:hypothetical protein
MDKGVCVVGHRCLGLLAQFLLLLRFSTHSYCRSLQGYSLSLSFDAPPGTLRLAPQLPLLPPSWAVGSAQKFEGGKAMYLTQNYSERISGKVEDLYSRVHLLTDRLAKQKVSVKLEHYWELAHVRSSFAEFKWRVEQLEEDDDLQLKRDQEVIEATWNDLMHSVDMLLAALSVCDGRHAAM